METGDEVGRTRSEPGAETKNREAVKGKLLRWVEGPTLFRAAPILLLFALSMSAAAQYVLVVHGNGSLATALYAIGLSTFVVGLATLRRWGGQSQVADMPSGPIISDRAALGAISALCMILSMATARVPSLTGASLGAWVASLVLAMAAAAAPDYAGLAVGAIRDGLRRLRPRLSLETAMVSIILVVGAALRLLDLEAYPTGVHGDEAEFGLIARNILEGHGPNPFGVAFLGDPAMFNFVEAPFIGLFGNTVFAIRLCSALAGVLTLPAFYVLLRRIFDGRLALLGLALLAGNGAHINYSRMALNISEVELLACLSIYALWVGYKGQRGVWWFSAGVAAGLAVYFYFAARVLPVILGTFFLYLLLTKKRERGRILKGLLLALLGGTMALAPMAVVMAGKPSDFTGHMTDRLIFSNWAHAAGAAGQGAPDPLYVLLQQLRTNLLGFVSVPDAGFYSFAGSPIVSPVIGFLVLLGLGLVLVGARDDRYALLDSWFWPVILINGVITIDPPQSGRVLLAVFPALAGVALVLDSTLTIVERAVSARVAPVLAFGAALVPVIAGYADVSNFFGPAAAARPWEVTTMQARYVASLGPGYRVYGAGTPSIYIDHGVTRFIASNVEGINLQNPAVMLPLAVPPDKDVAFLMYPHMMGYVPWILSLYPKAQLDPVVGRENRVLFTAVRVPKEEIAKWQGLLARYGGIERLETETEALGGAVSEYPTNARWTGALYVDKAGVYSFQLGGVGGDLLIDGDPAVQGQPTPLAVGWHALEVKSRLESSEARVALWWKTPGGALQPVASRWLDARDVGGKLVGSSAASGTEPVERRDRAIGFRNLSDLDNRSRSVTFTWEGALRAPRTGRYVLQLSSSAEAELIVDGRSVVATPARSAGEGASGTTVDLQSGDHSVRVRYSGRTEGGILELSWAPPGGDLLVVPPEAFGPPGR